MLEQERMMDKKEYLRLEGLGEILQMPYSFAPTF